MSHTPSKSPIMDPISRAASEHFHIDYLYPYQRLVISNVLEGRNQIVILPTGAGKSLCFQIPSMLLPGTTLVIFPLLSLMADQERRLIEAGIVPGVLKGGQSEEERKRLWRSAGEGRCRFVIANPEILLTRAVLPKLKSLRIAHLVVDEAHTVSEWGETFRPSYLRIGEIVEAAGSPLVTAFTATASPIVLEKIRQFVFGGEASHLVAGNPDRPNIFYSVLPVLSKNHHLTRLAESMEKPLIIFHRSRPGAEITSRMLRARLDSREVFFYHAALARDEKKRIEAWFYESKTGILCATCAYGMGVDKPDIRSVIHRDVPLSVESYLQESGRAGRDKLPSNAALLFSAEDKRYIETIEDSNARTRYRTMLAYCENPDRCRRESLLKTLGAEPEGCFGCDVCAAHPVREPEGLGELLEFVKKNRGCHTLGESSLMLSGRKNLETRERRLWKSRWFGRLHSWAYEDLKEAMTSLIGDNRVKVPRKGMFKGRLI